MADFFNHFVQDFQNSFFQVVETYGASSTISNLSGTGEIFMYYGKVAVVFGLAGVVLYAAVLAFVS